MDFDWSTFLLEMINFLVLVWILKRFLYHPILGVVAKRRADIEKTLADARRIEAEATKLQQHSQNELAQWEAEKETERARLREELAAERKRLLAELETTLAGERERVHVLDERHQRDLKRILEEQSIAQGATFSARLLSRLATPELEARLYALFLEDLRALRAEEKRALQEVAAPGLQFKVQSAFALDATKRAGLAQALSEVAGIMPEIEYRENPELLAGLQVGIGPWILHANLRNELKFFSGALRHAE